MKKPTHHIGQQASGMHPTGMHSCFLWSLSLLNVNIKLDSLWTCLEVMSFSLWQHYKRTQTTGKMLLLVDCKLYMVRIPPLLLKQRRLAISCWPTRVQQVSHSELYLKWWNTHTSGSNLDLKPRAKRPGMTSDRWSLAGNRKIPKTIANQLLEGQSGQSNIKVTIPLSSS